MRPYIGLHAKLCFSQSQAKGLRVLIPYRSLLNNEKGNVISYVTRVSLADPKHTELWVCLQCSCNVVVLRSVHHVWLRGPYLKGWVAEISWVRSLVPNLSANGSPNAQLYVAEAGGLEVCILCTKKKTQLATRGSRWKLLSLMRLCAVTGQNFPSKCE